MYAIPAKYIMKKGDELKCRQRFTASWLTVFFRSFRPLRFSGKGSVVKLGEIIIFFQFSGNRFCCDMLSASLSHLVLSCPSSKHPVDNSNTQR